MRIYKTEQKEIKTCTDITCDKCGRSCIGKCENYCGIHFTVSGSYDSQIFPDDETERHFDVCEFCADEWLKTWDRNYLVSGTNK